MKMKVSQYKPTRWVKVQDLHNEIDMKGFREMTYKIDPCRFNGEKFQLVIFINSLSEHTIGVSLHHLEYMQIADYKRNQYTHIRCLKPYEIEVLTKEEYSKYIKAIDDTTNIDDDFDTLTAGDIFPKKELSI